MRIFKIAAIALLVLLSVIQFFPTKKNVSTEISAGNISTVYTTPAEVKDILARSCNDCHSNTTTYPWYNNIQPVGWWLGHHVNEGKQKLNFDAFATYSPRRQYHKLEEVEEVISENEMPLPSYLWIHKNAALDSKQKETLINWSKAVRAEMEAKYPKDSLMVKRKK
jgi:hypothetical protein